NNYKKYIPLKSNKVQLHYFCNIEIDEHLNINETKKQKIKPFINFKDYYISLKKDLEIFISNANAKERIINYDLVTTISQEYDATACAAIAIDYGCDTAVTFNDPQKYADDSGEEIAKKIGYKNIIKKDANQYLENTKLIEAEFVSSGE